MNTEIEQKNKLSNYSFLSSRSERFLFLLGLTLLSAAPLIFRSGLPAHADWHSHIANAFHFKKCFWQGELLPRWIEGSVFGYGIPKFNYYAPLLYYLFTFIEIFCRNPVYSMKAVLILTMLLSTLFGYLYLRKHGSAISASLATVFIIFSPAIHMYTYNNNFPTNTLAIPFIFITLYGIDSYNKDLKFDMKSFLITVFGYTGMVLSHLATAFIFSLALIPYFLFSLSIYRTRSFIKFFILSIGCGLGLSAFYLIPAISETNLVHTEVLSVGAGWDYSKNFLFSYLDRLPSDGYYWGIFDHRYYEVTNALFGLVGLIASIVLLSNYDRLKSYIAEVERVKVAIFMLFITFIMMTPVSIFIWSMSNHMKTLQFPWRFTSLIIPFCCLTMVYTFDLISKFKTEKENTSGLKYINYSVILLLGLLIYVNFINIFRWDWARPQAYIKHAKYIVWQNKEYQPNLSGNPNWQNEDFSKDFSPSIISTDSNAEINLIKWLSHNRIFETSSTLEQQITLRIFYFPGWNVYIDNTKINLLMDPKSGAIVFKVPAGKHLIEAKFELTPLRQTATSISFITLILYLYLFITGFKFNFKLKNIQKPVAEIEEVQVQ